MSNCWSSAMKPFPSVRASESPSPAARFRFALLHLFVNGCCIAAIILFISFQGTGAGVYVNAASACFRNTQARAPFFIYGLS